MKKYALIIWIGTKMKIQRNLSYGLKELRVETLKGLNIPFQVVEEK